MGKCASHLGDDDDYRLHYFGYEALLDLCASFILKHLSAENCILYMLDAQYALFVSCKMDANGYSSTSQFIFIPA